MARRKPKTIFGMILSMIFAPISMILGFVMSYKPYNSRRTRKRKWF